MSYLRFTNWKKYQNADLAKKSPNGLAWVKLFTHRDDELLALPISTRLLFFELLKLAGTRMNAIPNSTNFISGHTGIPVKQVANGVEELLKGAWLTETKTPRNSRNGSRGVSRKTLELEVEVEVEKSKAFNLLENQDHVAKIRSLIDHSLREVG